MKERPILFSGPMVQAIRDSRKTQTRRVVKPQPGEHIWSTMQGYQLHVSGPHLLDTGLLGIRFQHSIPQNQVGEDPIWASCKFGQPGDRLWVKETHGKEWKRDAVGGTGTRTIYQATETDLTRFLPPWKPSIFMPRRLSRITLEIRSIRVERLQEISEVDAEAEGCPEAHLEHTEDCHHEHCALAGGVDDCCGYLVSAKLQYKALWESINGPGSWDANPFVWVIEFRRVN